MMHVCDQHPDRSTRDAARLTSQSLRIAASCRAGGGGHARQFLGSRAGTETIPLNSRPVVSVDRRIRLWSLLVAQAGDGEVALEHIGAVMLSVAGVTGLAVTVRLPATPREDIYASDRTAAEFAELVLTLGEGPSVDALADGPILVADITDVDCGIRWPAFTDAAIAGGVRAVFSLPLQVGAVRLGVMDLYRDKPGALDGSQLADALMLADTACALLLDGRIERPRSGRNVPARAGPHHPEVHQATGMISVQLGVSIAVALTRLRAYAYANERRLRDVAADVVARRLRFESDTRDGRR